MSFTPLVRRLAPVAGVLLVLLAFAPAAEATPRPAQADPSGISISPVGISDAYFTVVLAPGGVQTLTVELSNRGAAAADARTYPADVFTIVNGGFGARLRTDPSTSVTNWISYRPAEVHLAAGQAQQRSFTVTVPDDATPGEHLTSVVVEVEATAGNGPIALSQVSRQALPIVIDVPGRRAPALAIGDASQAVVGGRAVVSIGVTNPGNVRTHPAGRVVVTDDQGLEVGRSTVTMGTVFPGDDTTVEATLDRALPPGHYLVTATLSDAALGLTAERGDLSFDVTAEEAAAAEQKAEAEAEADGPAVAASGGLGIGVVAGLVGVALLIGGGVAAGVGAAGRRRRSDRQAV